MNMGSENSDWKNQPPFKIDGKFDQSVADAIRDGNHRVLWFLGENFDSVSNFDLSDLDVKKVSIRSTASQSIDWLGCFQQIETLDLVGRIKPSVDFTSFKNLRHVNIEWNAGSKNVINSDLPLEVVGLRKFSGSFDDFCAVTASSLKELGLTGSLGTMSGVSRFSGLESLSLWMMRNLIDISEITNLEGLKHLELEDCNNIEYIKILSQLKGLEVMFYENKRLKSLDCLPRDSLRRIRLGTNTVIEDSMVEKFLEFPVLEHVGFVKKKTYKYSSEQINDLLKERNSKSKKR